MKVGPLEFITNHDEHPLWQPTRAWAVPRPGAAPSDLDAWDLSLEPPASDQPCLPIHDLKRWILFGDKEERYLTLPATNRGVPTARRVRRDDACVEYLKAITSATHLGAETPVSVLMPALDDKKIRDRYLAMLARALPGARLLFEPEMVVEYFRLVRRSLRLDRDRNNVILVVDIGASTANVTAVISNRGGQVVGGTAARQRAERLRAIEGASGEFAGQWVDAQLAERLALPLPQDDEERRLRTLERIEQAKIRVASSSRAELIERTELNVALLEQLATEVATKLEPQLERVATRLWDQLTKTDEAQRLSHQIRQTRGIEGPKDALRFVDVVLLAGGTSQLPGFRSSIERHLVHDGLRFHEVGPAFPVAAALGGLAHVLHEQGKLQYKATDGEEAPKALLRGGLEVDIEFGWRRKHDAREQRLLLLQKGDPIVYEGGLRRIDGRPHLESGKSVRARISAALEPKSARRGQSFQPVTPLVAYPPLAVRVDSEQRIRVESDGIRGAASLVLPLHEEHVAPAPSRTSPLLERAEEGAVVFEPAEGLVIDFGMSKTVRVCSHAGELDLLTLDRLAAGARPHPSPDSAHALSLETALSQPVPGEPSPPPAVAPPAPQVQPTLLPTSTRTDDDESLPSKTETSIEPQDFIQEFDRFLRDANNVGIDVPADDLLMAVLGLSVRPTVLLAGPPGCGKSLLARLIAHLLGHHHRREYHEIPVQSHWMSDEPLFGDRGLLRGITEKNSPQLVLFDEMNLTRPEFYLTRLFRAMDDHGQLGPDIKLPKVMAIGTLNIDDTSRPPSPKVLDRCFLVEMGPAGPARAGQLRRTTKEKLEKLPPRELHIPSISVEHEVTDPRLRTIIDTLGEGVEKEGLRGDLLPSRRVREDLADCLHLYQALGPAAQKHLTEVGLVDRLASSRVLVKLAGPAEQLKTILDALDKLFEADTSLAELRLCKARLKLARRQAALGFISPWQ